MKNLLLSLLLIVLAVPTFAQYSNPTSHDGSAGYTLRKHEFRISAGAYPAIPNSYEKFDRYNQSMSGELDASKQFNGSTFTDGGYTISYTYRLRKWIDFGVGVTFSNEYFSILSNLDGSNLDRCSADAISVVPMARFTWLNRKLVRLYSSVGVGISFIGGNRKDINHNLRANGQIIPLGITVGRSLFGFAEVGYGAQGALIVGIGYSFNGKKAQR